MPGKATGRKATRPIPQALREPLAAMVWDLAEFGHCFKPSQELDRFFDEYGPAKSDGIRCLAVRRDAIAMQWLRLTGARFSEFAAIAHRDVVGNSVFLCGAKGSNDRTIELADSMLVDVTRKWWSEVGRMAYRCGAAAAMHASHLLVPSLAGTPLANDRFNVFSRAIGRMFGIRLTAHSLRDTAGHEIYLRTRDIRAVQRFMGHRSIRSTEIYLAKVTAEALTVPTYARARE